MARRGAFSAPLLLVVVARTDLPGRPQDESAATPGVALSEPATSPGRARPVEVVSGVVASDAAFGWSLFQDKKHTTQHSGRLHEMESSERPRGAARHPIASARDRAAAAAQEPDDFWAEGQMSRQRLNANAKANAAAETLGSRPPIRMPVATDIVQDRSLHELGLLAEGQHPRMGIDAGSSLVNARPGAADLASLDAEVAGVVLADASADSSSVTAPIVHHTAGTRPLAMVDAAGMSPPAAQGDSPEASARKKSDYAHWGHRASRDGLHSTDPQQADHGTHHSIFCITFATLDSMYFHCLLIGMLAFTIVVDRLESVAKFLASGNASHQRFLKRVNAEIMMFGFVGLGVFLFSQLERPSNSHFVFFEFVDIFCSLGAVVIIIMAVVLFAMQKRLERTYCCLESPQDHSTSAIAHQSKLSIMRDRFRTKHNLAPDFDFSLYLRESLAKNVCDLMDISWVTWIVLLFGVGVFTFVRWLLGPLFTLPTSYIAAYTVGAWTTWVLHIIILGIVTRSSARLDEDLGMANASSNIGGAQGLRGAETPLEASAFSARQCAVIEQVLQVVSITTGAFWALYFMHLIYNISVSGLSTLWHVAILLPLLLNLLLHLPAIIAKYSLLQAYYDPDHEIMDDTIARIAQIDEDIRFMRRQLKHRSGWERDLPTAFRGSKDLASFLSGLQVVFAGERVERLFQAIDKDASGTIDADEFIQAVGEADDIVPPPARTSSAKLQVQAVPR